MQKKFILYLSTNSTWGGSEILWTASAQDMSSQGYKIKTAVFYDAGKLNFLTQPDQYLDLRSRKITPSLLQRVAVKIGIGTKHDRDLLLELFKKTPPDLVIISQGNNSDALPFMKACVENKIPFVTLTHLVSEQLWPALTDDSIDELRKLYLLARSNCFVSRNTLSLHEKILGEKCLNSTIVYNPFTKKINGASHFPPVINEGYRIALIGRVEIYHKGYDLLLDVLKNEKWQQRPVHFSLFGKGPHINILNRLLHESKVLNFSICDYCDDISQVWKTHHILIMPSRMEGQSLTLIEAMHFNRPAIVTNVGGTNELIDEGITGFIAEYPTVEAIDNAMERAWERRADWEQMGINAGHAIREKHPKDPLSLFNRHLESILTNNSQP